VFVKCLSFLEEYCKRLLYVFHRCFEVSFCFSLSLSTQCSQTSDHSTACKQGKTHESPTTSLPTTSIFKNLPRKKRLPLLISSSSVFIMAEERIFSFLFTVLRYPVLLLLKNLLHVFLVFIGHKGCSWIKLLAPSLKATKISHFPLCHFLLSLRPNEGHG
jgi:hypothetical protein